jgi:hypothetical protein
MWNFIGHAFHVLEFSIVSVSMALRGCISPTTNKTQQIEAAVTNAKFYLGSDIPKAFGAHSALA